MIRVAIADDHPLLRAGIIDHIQRDNVNVVLQAKDGKDLLEKLKNLYEKGERVDVLILDVEMEPMSGTECLPILKEIYPTIKTIVLSQYTSHQVINDHLELGANCYLLKTKAPLLLIKAINEVYHNGRFRTDTMFDAMLDARQNPSNHQEKPNLSDREIEMIELIFYKEYSSEELADHFTENGEKITPSAVENAKTRLYNKFGKKEGQIRGVAGLIREAIKYGYLDI